MSLQYSAGFPVGYKALGLILGEGFWRLPFLSFSFVVFKVFGFFFFLLNVYGVGVFGLSLRFCGMC